jgi:Tol biopolymer transport system component
MQCLVLVLAVTAVSQSIIEKEDAPRSGDPDNSTASLIFASAGMTAMISADGTDLQWLEFDVPKQATWQVSEFFSDGRLLLLSMEPRRDGPGRSFEEYYTQTPTHLWRYDTRTKQLEELVTQERIAPFYTPQLLLGDDRILVQVVKDHIGQIYSMKLDGTDAREFTSAGEGLPYGFSMSPDKRRVAFHLASPKGYQVWTSDLDGNHRIQVAANPEHLYFGTRWSPDGQWIVFHDCHFKDHPGHDWSDLCIGRADGSENRLLTHGQSQWFAATYGPPNARGGGSNIPVWTGDGQLLFSRRLAGSKVPWEYQAQRPDVDHFNRDFRPDAARGGVEIYRCNPTTGKTVRLTHSDPPEWDFRASLSPNGQKIVFCRAATGQVPTLWIMNADGTEARQIATGRNGQGVDHPRWIPGNR